MQFTELCWLTGNPAINGDCSKETALLFDDSSAQWCPHFSAKNIILLIQGGSNYSKMKATHSCMEVMAGRKKISCGNCRVYNSAVSMWKDGSQSWIPHPTQGKEHAGSCYCQNTSHSPSPLLRDLQRASPTTGNFPSGCVLHWSTSHRIFFKSFLSFRISVSNFKMPPHLCHSLSLQ